MAYHQIPITTYQLIKSKIYCSIRFSVWNIICFGKKKKKTHTWSDIIGTYCPKRVINDGVYHLNKIKILWKKNAP